ncbi:MAG: hypothetical protein IAF02_21885 [Anaerolineae bacterium]|nr:hypothetical protein [Anaerolineae bacterium]
MNELKQKLAHIYWIGGSPCSGKSSIVDLLAASTGSATVASTGSAAVEPVETAVYHCDDHFDSHLKQTSPENQPEFYRLQGMSWDDLWMRPVPEQVVHELAIYREQFPMILADLLKLPSNRPLLVEGAALLPELVANVTQPNQAFYVVPTPEFQWRMYAKRPWIQGILDQCRDPEQAFRNWMERDVGFAEYVAETAVSLNYPVIHVDGVATIDDNAAQIACYFGW